MGLFLWEQAWKNPANNKVGSSRQQPFTWKAVGEPTGRPLGPPSFAYSDTLDKKISRNSPKFLSFHINNQLTTISKFSQLSKKGLPKRNKQLSRRLLLFLKKKKKEKHTHIKKLVWFRWTDHSLKFREMTYKDYHLSVKLTVNFSRFVC